MRLCLLFLPLVLGAQITLVRLGDPINLIAPATNADGSVVLFGAAMAAQNARLYEELAELAEAVRVFPSVPGYFLSEASDVFAWLMKVQNIIDEKGGRRFPACHAPSGEMFTPPSN
jgi:hypothetical protein